MKVFCIIIPDKKIPKNKMFTLRNFGSKGDGCLPAGRTIQALHFSPADRALVHCISATIRPDPCHRCHIMIVITGWCLEFSHILLSYLKMNCIENDFIVLVT
jgi:hypothetical protein